ncbi:MAG: hypothetical protein ACOYMS_01855 [Terrimicrobiaceae bacterium]
MKHEQWILALLTLGLFSCTTAEVYTPENSPEYMTVKYTPLYRRGPQQPGDPDMLEQQTLVRLVTKEYGFSRVQLADGRSGYVATDDIRLAPPSGRAVGERELFPERLVEAAPPLPEPDLAMPVAEIPQKNQTEEVKPPQ